LNAHENVKNTINTSLLRSLSGKNILLSNRVLKNALETIKVLSTLRIRRTFEFLEIIYIHNANKNCRIKILKIILMSP
jgi:hypothetical protein